MHKTCSISKLFTLLCFVLSHVSNAALIPFHTIPLVPDSTISPGQICTPDDPDFSHYRYDNQIAWCHRNVSWEERQEVYERYGIPSECQHRYTIDHIIPLSIGGSNAFENLWPEHRIVKEMRDQFEYEVFQLVRNGLLTQEQAIEMMMKEKYNIEEVKIFYMGTDVPKKGIFLTQKELADVSECF